MGRRPRRLASGTVNSVPMSPPRLKQLVASIFQLSPSVRAAAGSRWRAAAVVAASPLATSGMNALQLHHVTSAMNDIASPDSVVPRQRGENNSMSFGGGAVVRALA